jgi:hypothetical protein
LQRLEDKALVDSWLRQPSSERGGKMGAWNNGFDSYLRWRP